MAEEKVIIELDIKTDKAVTDTIALKEAVVKLTAEAKNLKETEGETSEAYVKKQAELKATQKELNATQNVLVGLTKAEEDATVTVQKLTAKNAELRLERDRTNINTKEGQDRIKAINAEMDRNTQVIKDNADAQKAQTMNVGNYVSALDGIGVPQAGAIKGMWGMVQAAWAFIATPIGAAIAAIAAVVYVLKEAFSAFDPIIDKIQQGMAALQAVFVFFKDTVISVVTGQKSLTESMDGLADGMARAVKEGIELKKLQQELDDMNWLLTESNAKAKRQIDELLLQSKDRTKSEEERISLINEALKVEEEAYNKKAEQAEQEYQIAFKKIAAGRNLTDEQIKQLKEVGVQAAINLKDTKEVTDEEVKNFADAIAKRETVLNESIAIREKAINRQNVLLDKAEEAELKRFEANKSAREKAAEERKKADDKAAKEKEEADKKALEDSKR